MIRKARMEDIQEVTLMAREVVNNLHELGIDQWDDTYPLYDHFLVDFQKDALYVIEEDGVICASMTLMKENEKFYHEVLWHREGSTVIHRIMVRPSAQKRHLGTSLMEFAIDYSVRNQYPSLKIDTHPDNFRMKAMLSNLGFVEVGYIPSMNRIGYEYLIKN